MTAETWLVTGGAGFLGTHLVERLVTLGCRVVVVDNLSWSSRDNLSFLSEKDYTFYKEDICDRDKMREIFSKEKPKYVVHLAAIHYIPACVKDPVEAVKMNVHGTSVILRQSIDFNATGMWFASTGDVYKKSEDPLHETESEIGPFNIYGQSKLMMENLINFFSDELTDKKVIIGRLFNLYGSRETNPHFLPEMIRQLKKDRNTKIKVGNLWPKRDLVPIAEAARAIVDSLLKGNKGVNTYNFATGVAQSMQEVLDMMGEIMGVAINVEKDESRIRSNERPHLQANVRALKSLIGYTPDADLKKGLKALLKEEGLIS